MGRVRVLTVEVSEELVRHLCLSEQPERGHDPPMICRAEGAESSAWLCLDHERQ